MIPYRHLCHSFKQKRELPMISNVEAFRSVVFMGQNFWTALLCCTYLFARHGSDLPLKIIQNPMDWLTSIATAVILYYVVPRLLGLIISIFLFRAVLSGFRLSVGSLGLFQLNDVSVVQKLKLGLSIEVHVSKISLSLWCMMLSTVTARKKYFSILISGARVQVKIDENQGMPRHENSSIPATASGAEHASIKSRVFGVQTGFLSYLFPPLIKLIVYALASWVEFIVLDSGVSLSLRNFMLRLNLMEFTFSMTKDGLSSAGHDFNLDLQRLLLVLALDSAEEDITRWQDQAKELSPSKKKYDESFRSANADHLMSKEVQDQPSTTQNPNIFQSARFNGPKYHRQTASQSCVDLQLESLSFKVNVLLSLLPAKLAAQNLFLRCGLLSGNFDCGPVLEVAHLLRSSFAQGQAQRTDFDAALGSVPRRKSSTLLRPEHSTVGLSRRQGTSSGLSLSERHRQSRTSRAGSNSQTPIPWENNLSGHDWSRPSFSAESSRGSRYTFGNLFKQQGISSERQTPATKEKDPLIDPDPYSLIDKFSHFLPEDSEIVLDGTNISFLISSDQRSVIRRVEYHVAPIEMSIIKAQSLQEKQISAGFKLGQEISLRDEGDGELYEICGVEIKLETGWDSAAFNANTGLRGATAAEQSAASFPWIRLHWEVKCVRLKVNTGASSILSDVNKEISGAIADPLQTTGDFYFAEQKQGRAQTRSFEPAQLKLSSVKISAILHQAEAAVGFAAQDSSGVEVVMGCGEVSMNANGAAEQFEDAAVQRSFRQGLNRKRYRLVIDVGIRMNGLHAEMQLSEENSTESFQLLLLDSCSAYVKLENAKLSSNESTKGEVVGLKLWFEERSARRLLLKDLLITKKAPSSVAQQPQTVSQSLLPVKIHFQNIKVFVEATLLDSPSHDIQQRVFVFTLDISKGKLERKFRQSLMTLDLETAQPVLTSVLSVMYHEFIGSERGFNSSMTMQSESRMGSNAHFRQAQIEHTLLRIYSIKIKYMPKMKAAVNQAAQLEFESAGESDSAEESEREALEGKRSPDPSFGLKSKNVGGSTKTGCPTGQLPEEHEELGMVDGTTAINVGGVRLNWHPFVQYSMLHFILPLLTMLKQRGTAESTSATRPPTRWNSDIGFDRTTAGRDGHQRTDAVRLCLNDVCMFFSFSERSVIGLELNDINVVKPGWSEPDEREGHTGLAEKEMALRGCVSGISIHRIHDVGFKTWGAGGQCKETSSSRFAFLPLRSADLGLSESGDSVSWLSKTLRTDRFLDLKALHVALSWPPLAPVRVAASVGLVGLVVTIPWTANLSTHGRKEGMHGRWNGTRLRGREGISYWTDLGIMGNEAILYAKAFQLYIYSWIRGPDVVPTVTEFPAILGEVRLDIDGMRVRLEDDPWEVWVGTIFRLRADEVGQQLEQRVRLSKMSSTGLPAEAQAQVVEAELQRLDATLWKRRVQAFKDSAAFRNMPPLFDVRFKTISCSFTPRPAAFLMEYILKFDGSGLQKNLAQWPKLDTLLGGELREGVMTALCVRVRDHCEPVLQVSRLHFCPDGPDGPAPGVLAATEEICPKSHVAIVERRLHPALPPTRIPRSYASMKIWGQVEVTVVEPRITVGPSVLPAVSMISNTMSGVTPPGQDPSPSLSAWDKARLLLHCFFSVRMDKACVRLLSDRDPHTSSECLQLRGEGISVTNIDDAQTEPSQPAAGGGWQWRMRIACERMRWDIESKREEMTSAMLLQLPLFKAVRLEMTITMHWKCRGRCAAHHYMQMIAQEQRHSASLQKGSSQLPVHESAESPLRSSIGVNGSLDKVKEEFEDADEIPGLREASKQDAAEAFDTYSFFRSSALALTLRISAKKTHTVLHINTMRWIADFIAAVEKESDPVRRYIGSIDTDGKRRKRFIPRSSLSMHTKAVQVRLLIEHSLVDCFYVGDHRIHYAKADPAAAATVGKLVLSFSSDILNLIMRMERFQRRPSSTLVMQRPLLMSDSGLDLETATGFWNMVSIWVRFNNFFAHTLPPWPDAIHPPPTSPRTKEDQRIPSRPIASSTRVTIQSGEALTEAEPKAVPGSPARGPTGLGHYLSPGVDRTIDTAPSSLHRKLLRQSSHRPDGSREAFHAASLHETIQRMKESPGLLRTQDFDGRRFFTVVRAGELIDWAVREELCKNDAAGRELGAALLKQGLIRHVDWSPIFLDPAAGGMNQLFQLRKRLEEVENKEYEPVDSWSYEWGHARPGRLSHASGERASGPLFKLCFQALCLQWTQESREAMTDWLTQLTLATKPGQHSAQASTCPAQPCSKQSDPNGSHTAESPPLRAVVQEESLVEFLRRTAHEETPAIDGGIQSDLEGRDGVASLFDVAWVIEFEEPQLGVEAFDSRVVDADRKRERLVVSAKSAIMHLLRPQRRSLPAGGISGAALGGREQLVLTMKGLEADAVLGDIFDGESLDLTWRAFCKRWLCSDNRVDASDDDVKKYKEQWGSTVWHMEEFSKEKHLLRVLDIGMNSETEGIEFVYSYFSGNAPEEFNSVAQQCRYGEELEHFEPLPLGDSDIKVNKEMCAMIKMVVGQVNFATDCSLVRHFFKCFNSMVDPLPEQAQSDREIEEIFRILQLQPETQRAQDRDQLEGSQERLCKEILSLEKSLLKCRSSLSNDAKHHPPIVTNHVLDNGQTKLTDGRDPHAREAVLRSMLKGKWRQWRRNHLKLNALKRADDGPETTRRLAVIEVKVNGGEWVLGPSESPFAKLTLRDLRFSMELDQRLSVPVLYTFSLGEFRLCPAKVGGDLFNEVLGPRSEPKAKSSDAKPRRVDGRAPKGDMLSVKGKRLPKFAGEQMVLDLLEFQIHPLDVQLTEDMGSSLYYFAFPGTWTAGQWVGDDRAESVNQKREFYQVDFVSCNPWRAQSNASDELEVSQSGNSCGVDNDIDTGEILIGAASEICSGAGESEDMRTGHGSTWTGFPGRNEEEEDVKRLRQRAQDNVEFRSVCIAAPPHIGGRRRGGDSGGCSEGGLEMSISYRGRKGLVPDIEALVVLIPEVKFPRDTSAEAVVICTWEGLFHMWLQEVRWAVITQVSRSIWSKVKLRRTPKRSTDSERHDQPKLEPSHPAMQGTFSNLSDGQGSKPHKGLSTRLGSRHNLHIESGTENRQDDSTTPDSENPELEEAYRSYGIQLPQDRSCSDGRSRQALVEASKSYGVLKPP